MKKYECLYIVNINYDSEGTSTVSARVEAILKNVGAELANTQPWGKRKLAYAIDKERYGDYVLIHFQGENVNIDEFHRELEIDNGILHYMTIRLDEFPDFDSLSIPQIVETDRKRPTGGRRPRYDDSDDDQDDSGDGRRSAPDADEVDADDTPDEDIDAEPDTADDAENAVEETPEAAEEPEMEKAEAAAVEENAEESDASAEDEDEDKKPADSE